MALTHLADRIAAQQVVHRVGTVTAVRSGSLEIAGLGPRARVGDLVHVSDPKGATLSGEVVALDAQIARVMTYQDCQGAGIGGRARLEPFSGIFPSAEWTGRIVDVFGQPLDGRPLAAGSAEMPLKAPPPPAAERKAMGKRMHTGIGVVDTMLPLARGQRIGIFAGSGVGKSTLLANFAKGAAADRVVFALIGERGRELRHFTDHVLGPDGMKRSVLIAATSDQSPLVKRRAAWTAMSVAEYFRDRGEHVLLIVDSLTRMAEAHREVALTAGEAPTLRAYPPSTGGLISAFAERAGPGTEGTGDITAVFSILVAGSDMEEPVADIARGVLDGHIVLDREIAERGRFPAIDVRRSVSRSLPDIATDEENALISASRRVLGTYEGSAPMIQAGLYTKGTDADIDAAIEIWPRLDRFFESVGMVSESAAFEALKLCLHPGSTDRPSPASRVR